MTVTAMKCVLDTMASDGDTEKNQHVGNKMIPGLIVLGLVFICHGKAPPSKTADWRQEEPMRWQKS